MNCPGYLGPRERMTAGMHCEEVNYAEREHAKILRDEVTEAPETILFHSLGGFQARRKCKYNREEHRWRCIADADQAWKSEALVDSSQADVDRVSRMQHDPMMGRKNVSGTSPS